MKKKVLAIVITLVLIVLVLPMGFHAEQTNDDCITFSSSDLFYIKVRYFAGWDGTIQYSTDKTTWNTWDGSSISAVEDNGMYYIYFRGYENTVITNGYYGAWNLETSKTGQTIDCSGNIETLRGAIGDTESSTPMADNCYSFMFSNCASLAKAPSLSATNLAERCYAYMFYNCTSLEEVPALSAMALARDCCYFMFGNCASLAKAPSLPAMTLAECCYSCMFYGCASLTKAPLLPATALAKECYSAMFGSCVSLEEAPSLPATTLAKKCYSNMFMDCAALKKAPVLPATTLAEECYQSMFVRCTFTKAPALPAKNLAKGCYNYMFGECKSLEEAPALPATTLVSECYYYMFGHCTSLLKPANMSHITNIVGYSACKKMYYGCENLRIYTAPTEDCQTEWLCPAVEGQTYLDLLQLMFFDTIGDVNTELGGTVSFNTIYYILGDGGKEIPYTGEMDAIIYISLLIMSVLGLGIIIKIKSMSNYIAKHV